MQTEIKLRPPYQLSPEDLRAINGFSVHTPSKYKGIGKIEATLTHIRYTDLYKPHHPWKRFDIVIDYLSSLLGISGVISSYLTHYLAILTLVALVFVTQWHTKVTGNYFRILDSILHLYREISGSTVAPDTLFISLFELFGFWPFYLKAVDSHMRLL